MVLNLMFYLIIILFSFYLLIKSADYLISSASILGERAGISKFVIGLTLIAVGTSLPELFTAIFGVLDSSNNASSFVFGTVIGSNIANILLVFAILLIFSKNFKVKLKLFDSLFLFFTTISLFFVLYFEILNFYIGIIYLLLFGFYLYFCVKLGSKKSFEEEVVELEESYFTKKKSNILVLIFVLSLFGLNLAAKGVVYGISNFGLLLNIPISFLTFTTVAFATSLPEIIVSYSSAKKKEFDLAVGNIIGSNISNILFILGNIGLITNLSFNYLDYISSFYILLFVTVLFLFLLSFKKISQPKIYGLFLFIIYIIYIIIMF